jgi:hypothetical protein
MAVSGHPWFTLLRLKNAFFFGLSTAFNDTLMICSFELTVGRWLFSATRYQFNLVFQVASQYLSALNEATFVIRHSIEERAH